MICKVCKHCGLCPGDGINSGDLQIQLKNEVPVKFKCNSLLPSNQIGIAFDIGTTTIACRSYTLADGKLLCSFGEKNLQAEFGFDVVSRISYSMTDGGLKKLSDIISSQMSQMAKKALSLCQLSFSAQRKGRAELKRIVVSGNTVMESILAGISTAGLGTYPFTPGSSFGFSRTAVQVFGQDFFAEDCRVWFFPVVSAFVGGDAVASMLACGFNEPKESLLLADIGTNCELCAATENGKIFCTSTSAGPAFEGYGIECGSIACEGSISDVSVNNGKLKCSVIGGRNPSSINGTGLVSAVSSFLDLGIIDSSGAFAEEYDSDRFFLDGNVYLSQKDIRNYQLAKASVCSGIQLLLEKAEINCSGKLFLSGGFGTRLKEKDAFRTGLLHENFCKNVVSFGNTSIAGAAMVLLDDSLEKTAGEIVSRCTLVDLAGQKEFQDKFVKAMNF